MIPILLKISKKSLSNLTFSRYRRFIGGLCMKLPDNETLLTPDEKLIKKFEDVIYHSDYLDEHNITSNYRGRAAVIERFHRAQEKISSRIHEEPLPLSLKYLGYERTETPKPKTNSDSDVNENKIIQFPFDHKSATPITGDTINPKPLEYEEPKIDYAKEFGHEVRTRLELLNKGSDHLKWMNDYESFPYIDEETEDAQILNVPHVNYGTPDPNSKITNYPCGGCGALLHCKDPSIPGYIPSELFRNAKKSHDNPLDRLSCQRCHFLKHYNMALQVRVSPEDYPKVLRTIGEKKRALVILMVDLLDFPCSIWPGITDLIGYHRDIIVVGNKVDLLPSDGKGFLQRVEKNLRDAMKINGFATTNIKHVSLISAKTGYGVEDLITRLHSLWQYRGDVFIVGCTNVGKSSLFNMLLNSDYCRDAAEDLIERATTSPWPGTTLNLLKFPITRLSGWRVYVRAKRLASLRKLEAHQNRLRVANDKSAKFVYPTLMGHIERSFDKAAMDQDEITRESSDVHAVNSHRNPRLAVLSSQEVRKKFEQAKSCYDTPGVVQPQQIIHLLTTEELMNTLPNELIKPRTFSIQPGMSLFIGGLARLDYLEGDRNIKFTVYRSHKLPLTICKTSHAEEIYKTFLLSNILVVPTNNKERISLWPGLSAAPVFKITGIERNFAANDVVLSNAGWISVTPDRGFLCKVQGWTPEGKGIHLRDSLLPYSVKYRGTKIRRSCAYD